MDRDLLWKMEMAEAQLTEDINFLHCIREEFLSDKEPTESVVYIYWQLQAMITTLTKSMEYNQKEMREAIDENFRKLNKQKTTKEGVA